ncbi:MAG: hypothetical protein U0Q21_10305 [Dermatophilaceae bacterium]
MGAAEPGRRRFVTRADVEDARAAGIGIRLGPRDVLTDEAATRARDLGVAVERMPTTPAPSSAPASDGGRESDAGALRAALRAAVAAELGQDTPGLDAAIDRVLARRRP